MHFIASVSRDMYLEIRHNLAVWMIRHLAPKSYQSSEFLKYDDGVVIAKMLHGLTYHFPSYHNDIDNSIMTCDERTGRVGITDIFQVWISSRNGISYDLTLILSENISENTANAIFVFMTLHGVKMIPLLYRREYTKSEDDFVRVFC